MELAGNLVHYQMNKLTVSIAAQTEKYPSGSREPKKTTKSLLQSHCYSPAQGKGFLPPNNSAPAGDGIPVKLLQLCLDPLECNNSAGLGESFPFKMLQFCSALLHSALAPANIVTAELPNITPHNKPHLRFIGKEEHRRVAASGKKTAAS